jgi:DNA-binding NarL/FixJ family response regulator
MPDGLRGHIVTRRVILADDHQLLRAGLRSLLVKERDLEVVAEASDGRQAVELVIQHNPDLAILDIGMPNLNGIDAARQIRESSPHTRVIALSMHASAQFVGRMLEAGASGYLLKEAAYEELVQAIKTVFAGHVYLSRGITGVVVDDYVRRLAVAPRVEAAKLTPREREIAQMIAEGRSTKEIAGHLHVSVKTVETHRQHIMEKLKIDSVAELTKYAIREGLTELGG